MGLFKRPDYAKRRLDYEAQVGYRTRGAFPDADDRAWLRAVVRAYTGLEPEITEAIDHHTGHVALSIRVVDDETGRCWTGAVSQPVAERNERGICRYFKAYGWPQAKPQDATEILAAAERAFDGW